MKYLHKFVSLFLALLMLLSAFPVSADEHWAAEYLIYAAENGLWYENQVTEPDIPITRAELAFMAASAVEMPTLTKELDLFDDVAPENRYYYNILATALGGVMVGDNRLFRPQDTLTREEMAVILDRLYTIIDHTQITADIVSNRFSDFDSISLWAAQAVFNAIERNVMLGVSAKLFAPKQSLTRAEAAKVISSLDRYYKEKKAKAGEPEYLVYDASDSIISNPKSKFSVYQSAGAVNVLGIAGFAVLGYYESGPGEIYLSRTTTVPPDGIETSSQSTQIPPTAIAAVYDPDGNTIATLEFPIMESGKVAKIVKPDCKKAGVYTVRVMNGRTGDNFEIGMQNTDYWGVRGERHFGAISTLPNPAYVYAQSKNEFVHVGINGDKIVQLKDLEDNIIGTTAPKNRTNPFITHEINLGKVLQGDTVYKLEFPADFSNGLVIDGIPGLMCPTREAAEFFKGGWYDIDGTLYQGVIQKRAREEIVRLATEKNLDVVVNKPEELPDVKNPLAEATLFGAYAPISGLGNAIKYQITDPQSPYCGRMLSQSEFEKGAVAEELDYQACNFYRLGSHGVGGMYAAATVPLELNYFYMNDALIQRTAMAVLYWMTLLSEDGYVRQNNLAASYYPLTAGMFILHEAMKAYMAIEDYVDPETKAVLDSCFTMLIDKQGDYRGQGVTNQTLFCFADRLLWYQYTGIERHHDTFKRGINSLIFDNGKWNANYHITDGYFVEGGLDSSYNYMNLQEYCQIVKNYMKTYGADKELLQKMYDIAEETLYFESFFCAPQPEYSSIYSGRGTAPTNSFVSRSKNVALGSGGNASYEQFYHLFPIAARRFMVRHEPSIEETYPFVINNDEWAMNFIKKHWDAYENYFDGQDRTGNDWIFQYLDARESDVKVEPCLLPCEEPDGTMWDRPGFMFFKHDGLYYIITYNCTGIPNFTPTRNNYSIMGGAPVLIWNETAGTTICSHKHLTDNATPVLTSDVVASCLFGDDGSGNITFASGREGASLKWIEEGKEFEISGAMPADGRIVTWRYRLEDDGVNMTASVSGVSAGEQVYLNLPFLANDLSGGAELALDGSVFTFTFGGKTVAYTWDDGISAELIREPVNGVYNVKLSRLRIKVPDNGKISVKINCYDAK